MELQKEVTL